MIKKKGAAISNYTLLWLLAIITLMVAFIYFYPSIASLIKDGLTYSDPGLDKEREVLPGSKNMKKPFNLNLKSAISEQTK